MNPILSRTLMIGGILAVVIGSFAIATPSTAHAFFEDTEILNVTFSTESSLAVSIRKLFSFEAWERSLASFARKAVAQLATVAYAVGGIDLKINGGDDPVLAWFFGMEPGEWGAYQFTLETTENDAYYTFRPEFQEGAQHLYDGLHVELYNGAERLVTAPLENLTSWCGLFEGPEVRNFTLRLQLRENFTGEEYMNQFTQFQISIVATQARNNPDFCNNPQPQEPPSASFTNNPQHPLPGQQVTFDASMSDGGSGTNISYEWDWDTDGTYDANTTSPTILHVFQDTGTHTVGLRVTADTTLSATTHAVIHVGPYIEEITPSVGAPGTEATIRGWNFAESVILQRFVYFGDASAQIKSWPQEQPPDTEEYIVVTIPHGTGTVEVRVETVPTESNHIPFTYAVPHIDALAPEEGPIRTPVTISGSDFGEADFSSSFNVRFGRSVTIGDPWSDNEILAHAPSDYGTGTNSRRLLSCVLIITGGQVASYLATQGISIIGLPLQKILEHLGTSLGPLFGDFLLPQSCLDGLASLALDGIDLSPQNGTVKVPVTVVTPAGESAMSYFTYQVPSLVMAQLHSPGDLRVYDSAGHVTGMVDGIAKEEIPFSLYNDEDKTVMIPSAFDTYRFEIFGTGNGVYGLDVASSSAGGRTTFHASNVHTEPGIDHRYAIDWQKLSNNEKGVELSIDLNNDGVPEETLHVGETFEYVDVKGLLEESLVTLQSINTNNRDINKATDAVEKDLDRVIADTSWLGRNRLSWPKGVPVVLNEIGIVRALDDIRNKAEQKKNNIPARTQALYQDAQDEVIQSSALLAKFSFEKVKAIHAKNSAGQKTLDKAIVRIQKMLDRALDKEAKKPEQAVQLYSAVWFVSEMMLKASGAIPFRATSFGPLYNAENMSDLMD